MDDGASQGLGFVADLLDGDWYEATRRCTMRLVNVRSVSPGAGESAVAEEVLRLLDEDGLDGAYTASGLDAIPGDPHGRRNAYAFLRGRSARAVVLMGHIDTVDTADYGSLEPWALDPLALDARRDELCQASPGLAADLAAHPNDWMFGRGVADMKSGVAAAIAVLRRYARHAQTQGAPPLSVVLLATVDEENESAGVLQALRLLERLRAEHGLEYVGAINTDYTTARYPGDPHRYIYSGTVGKLLPCFLAVGRPSHAGDPFDGLDANLIAAELVRDLSMNPNLCDTASGFTTPPPVTLHARDLKTRYDTQLPFAAAVYLNVLTLTTGPAPLLERLHVLAEASLRRVLQRVDRAEHIWLEGQGRGVNGGQTPIEAHSRSGQVLSYAALYDAAVRRIGAEGVRAALDVEWAGLPDDLDRRERSLRLVWRLWTLSGLSAPAVILYYAPPYYPHVAATPSALHRAVSAVAAAHPKLQLVHDEYFPLLCDMSYLRLDPRVDPDPLRHNMPVWQEPDTPDSSACPGGYSLPLDLMRALDLPVANIGPYGFGAHQAGERVLMSYAFDTVPRLINETIDRLAV